MKRFLSFAMAVALVLCALCISGNTVWASETTALGGGTSNNVRYIESLDIFVLCGSDGVYTSTKNSDWVKRCYEGNAVDFAYGKKADIGIIVVNGRDNTTPVLLDNMNRTDIVANIVDGGYSLRLRNSIFYDELSDTFWAAGVEYDEDTKKWVGLYYTDGAVSNGTITWKRSTGDYLAAAQEQGADIAEGHAYKKISGNNNGVLAVVNHINSSMYLGEIQMQRIFSAVLITGNISDGTFSYLAEHKSFGQVAAYADVTQDGRVIVEQNNSRKRSVYKIESFMEENETHIIGAENALTAPNEDQHKTNTKAVVMLKDAFISIRVDYIWKMPYTNGLLTEFIQYTECEDILGDLDAKVKSAAFSSEGDGYLCIAYDGGAIIYDLKNNEAVNSTTASAKYTHISGNDTEITLSAGTSTPHGLILTDGTDGTADEMLYEYEDIDNAKYQCDLDGIDVNGIYAWSDAVPGSYRFKLKAYSADYPSIMKTIEITAVIQ